MPNFDNIIRNHALLQHHAGKKEEEKDEVKRKSLISALLIRKGECLFRSRIAASILLLAVIVLMYLAVFNQKGLNTFKEVTGILGGGSIIALLYYIISLRDEITKIKQTIVMASAMDDPTLNAMLLTLSSASK